MKQTKTAWMSIAALIIVLTAGYWWFTSSQYVDALVSAQPTTDGTGSLTMQDGVSGGTKQTDAAVVHPLGDSAGPIVDVRTMTVAQVVANLDATDFTSLFSSENGNALVSGSGKFTVFVPTNGAYEREASAIAQMSSAAKARLVAYHVIQGRALDSDAVVAGSVLAASGDAINVNFSSNNIPLIESAIVVTQYNCANGVVYTINNVLLPPAKV
jgi:transforming growth factor-beta-induced protein